MYFIDFICLLACLLPHCSTGASCLASLSYTANSDYQSTCGGFTRGVCAGYSEDCLSLNVYAPRASNGTRSSKQGLRPVMVVCVRVCMCVCTFAFRYGYKCSYMHTYIHTLHTPPPVDPRRVFCGWLKLRLRRLKLGSEGGRGGGGGELSTGRDGVPRT